MTLDNAMENDSRNGPMKPSSLLATVRIVALALALAFFGSRAYAAETPREELIHAYRLLEKADHDYEGHRVSAMKEVEAAGKLLGITLKGDLEKRETQWKSDKQLAEAHKLLRHAHGKLEAKDRELAGVHVEAAVKELNVALKVK
jgi:hypothetical protein